MAKRGKKQNRKTNQETVYNIPDGFLKGELISHPRYGKGFITDINSDGTLLCARFDFDGLIHNISLPDELPLLFTCDQNESITSFLNQRFGCYECRRCKKRMWPHTFTDTQKAIYDTDQICEKCDSEKYECPICGNRFFLADDTMLEKDQVYICHSCFQEYFTGIPEPFQREAYSYEFFQEKGMSRTEFYQYLINCNELCSIIHAFSLSRRMEDDGKYFLTLLKPKLEAIMRFNGVPKECISHGIRCFPLYGFSAWIYCDKGVVEDRIVSFSENSYCVVTATAFRSMIEAVIRNYTRNGKWITLQDREHEPLHSISEDTYDEAVNMLWTRGLELSNEIDDFKSYEELSEFYTRQDGIPDYESMSETLESSLDGFFRTIDRQESLQAQVNQRERVLFVCNEIMRCEREHHSIISVRLSVPTLTNSSAEINANYCIDCDMLFIYLNDYEYFRDCYGLPLIRLQINGSPGNTFEYGADQSILFLSGYSVNANKNLSAPQRRQILASLVATGTLSKSRINMYLNWFIDHNGRIPGHETAVAKWRADLQFLYSLGFENQIKMIADRIDAYKG